MKRDRPWMPFYTADWTTNLKLKRCTHEEKGVWIDVLCLMHESEEYGVLRWPLAELAGAVRTTVKVLKSLVEKGVLKGTDAGGSCEAQTFTPTHGRKRGPTVTILESQAGPIWFSSRMVEDEYKRLAKQGLLPAQEGAPKSPPNTAPKPPIGEAFGVSPNTAPYPSPPTRARETEDRGQNKNKSVNGGVGASHVVGAVDNSDAPLPLSADAVGEQLVLLESERGKTLSLSSRAREALLRIAGRGIGLPVLLRAHALACARRASDHDTSAVNPGFLEAFVDEVLAERQGGAPPMTDWDATPEGVQAKAAELGVERGGDEHAIWFRLRVIRETGDQRLIEREVSKAERMNPGEFERVYRLMYGVAPGQVMA